MMKLSFPTRPHIRLAAALILGTTYLVSGLDADQAEPLTPLKIAIACSPKQFLDFQKYLETNFHVACVRVEGLQKGGVENTERLALCDVMLLNLYRAEPTPEQLKRLQDYFASGKPVVGTRKASHALQNWLQIDRVVFGAKYGGHFNPKGEKQMRATKAGKDHPLLAGLARKAPIPGGGLYNYTELAPDVEVLLEGGAGESWMPQTWTRVNKEKKGQRVVYTRYDPDDVHKYPEVRDHVVRSLFWAAGRDLEKLKRAAR